MPKQKEKEEETTQKTDKLSKKNYEGELRKLQTKLVEMQEWVTATRARVVVVFEGSADEILQLVVLEHLEPLQIRKRLCL